MSQIPAINTTLSPEAAAKFNAWGKIGLAVGETELKLQAAEQAASARLVAPPDINACAAAEETLKDVKMRLNNLIAERKKLTSRLDAVTERLMKPEKALQGAIATQTAAIVAVKQAHANSQATATAKTAERTALRELVGIYIAQTHAAYLRKQAELLDAAYKHALTVIAPGALDEYLAKVAGRVTAEGYTTPAPDVTRVLLTAEELAAELADCFKPQTGADYVDAFALALKEKFSDYETAWANKDAALAVHQQATVATQQAISEEATIATAEVRLEAAATPMEVGPVVKPLKESFEVDMPDDYTSALTLMAACIAHHEKVGAVNRTTKFDSFGVKTIKTALGKIKSEDNDFDPKGVVFKKVEKL